MGLKDVLKASSEWLFVAGDRLGLHVLPKHFYTPVPDIAWLRKHPRAWRAPAPLIGVEWNLEAQLAWLAQICAPYYPEVSGFRVYKEIVEKRFGPGFGMVESQVLHCYMRSLQPRQVVEIGSGASTAVMLYANRLNGGGADFTCVEPFPKARFADLGGVRHVRDIVQTVPIGIFDRLAAGDLLFIDSTHSVKVGSDVLRIYLDILPRLRPGVFVHIHDIYLPYLYPRNAVSAYYGAQETSLVLGLLTNNPHLTVRCCLSALHYAEPARLRTVLPDYRPQENVDGLRADHSEGLHFPSSLWLQTA